MIHRSCDYVSVKLLTYLNSKGLNRSVPKILGVDHGSVHVDGRGVDPAVEDDGEHAGPHLGGTKPRSLTPTWRVLLVCLNRPACGSSIRAYILKTTRFDYCAQYCYKDPTDCEVCTRPYLLPWTPHEPRLAAATGLLMLNSHCGHHTLHKMIHKLKTRTQTKRKTRKY